MFMVGNTDRWMTAPMRLSGAKHSLVRAVGNFFEARAGQAFNPGPIYPR